VTDPEAADEIVVRRVHRWQVIPPFEMWLGVTAIYTGLSELLPFLNPAGSARVVVQRFPELANVWGVLYALGGLAMVVGLLRRAPRIEAAGLHLFGSGLTVAILATIAAGAPLRPTLIIQGGLAVAIIVRLLVLQRLSA